MHMLTVQRCCLAAVCCCPPGAAELRRMPVKQLPWLRHDLQGRQGLWGPSPRTWGSTGLPSRQTNCLPVSAWWPSAKDALRILHRYTTRTV